MKEAPNYDDDAIKRMKEFLDSEVRAGALSVERAAMVLDETLKPRCWFSFGLKDLFSSITLLGVGMGMLCFVLEDEWGPWQLIWFLWLASGAAIGAGLAAPFRLKFRGALVGIVIQVVIGGLLIASRQPFMGKIPVPLWATLRIEGRYNDASPQAPPLVPLLDENAVCGGGDPGHRPNLGQCAVEVDSGPA